MVKLEHLNLSTSSAPYMAARVIDKSIEWPELSEYEQGRGRSFPLKLDLFYNIKRTDMIVVGCIFIVSQKMVDALTKHGITGWTTYPIELYNGNIEYKAEKYWGFSILNKFIEDPKLSKGLATYGRNEYYICFASDVSGLDIFFINGEIVITKRFATALRKEKIRGWSIDETINFYAAQ